MTKQLESSNSDSEFITVGWREWCLLPQLGLPFIKAKIDTGARTSCLHAFSIEEYYQNNKKWVKFGIHPLQNNTDTEVYCDAEVIDERIVSDSGGHKEQRYVIATQLILGDKQWTIELTLTNRDTMRFRMLLGRTAMENRIIVNPAKSFLLGKHKI